jgi:hypothetical protein
VVFNIASSNGDGGLVAAEDDGNKLATAIISWVFFVNNILKKLSILTTPTTE